MLDVKPGTKIISKDIPNRIGTFVSDYHADPTFCVVEWEDNGTIQRQHKSYFREFNLGLESDFQSIANKLRIAYDRLIQIRPLVEMAHNLADKHNFTLKNISIPEINSFFKELQSIERLSWSASSIHCYERDSAPED